MIRSLLLKIRRYLLKVLVPEFIWPEVIEIDGVKVKLRGAPYSFGIKNLLAKNADSYEKAERSFLNVLKPNDHVLEYGSSIGILTALICERVPDGKVVSVEVSKRLLDYSKSWLSRYKHLTLVNAAAFPIYKRLELKLSFDSTSGSLGGVVDYNEPNSSSAELRSFFIQDAFDVPDFIPTVLVVDIEGSEDIVLKEPMELPVTVDRIILELHSFIYGDEVQNQIIDKVEAEGFQLAERSEAVYLFVRVDKKE